jgi:hypothetical protein
MIGRIEGQCGSSHGTVGEIAKSGDAPEPPQTFTRLVDCSLFGITCLDEVAATVCVISPLVSLMRGYTFWGISHTSIIQSCVPHWLRVKVHQDGSDGDLGQEPPP